MFDKPDLLVENVEKFASVIMLPCNHPLANKEHLKLSDLREEVFVTLRPQESEEGYNYIMSLLHRYGVTPKLKLVDSLANVMLWVETGGCVSISSNRTTEKNNPAVVFRAIPDLEEHDTVLAWRKNNYNPAISLFMELFKKVFSGEA